MVSNLIRMNLAMQRKPWSGARIFWLSVGLLLAAGTIALGVTNADNPPLAVDLLASACAAWTLGMALAPVFSGGGGIRAEHFALLPIPPRKLAAGLLGAALVGVLPAVALIAFAALAIFGFMHGIGPGLIGVAVTLLQLIVAVLLARVVHGVMGQAMQTQIGMELVAFYIALLVAMVSVGWFAIEPLTGQTAEVLTEGWPPALSTAFRVLPSGWGIVAVDAAFKGEWGLVIGALLAFGGLIGGLLLAWAALLARSLTLKPASRSVRGSAGPVGPALDRWLPQNRLGAVVARELRAWVRDPWRALELRIALWSGLLMGAIPLAAGFTEVLPFAGITIVIMGSVVSGNLLGLDGSALWQTILTPGAERIDIRGRQWAWLLIFGPVSLAVTIVFTLVTGHHWAWPLVLALEAALLGGAVGLMVVFSVFFPSPGIDPRMRKNPMDSSGEMVTGAIVMPWLAGLTALPAAAVSIMGLVDDNLLLQWLGVPVGMLTGIGLAWGLGYLAYRRLEARGPELLNLMLKGATPQAKKDAKPSPADAAWKTLPLGKKIVVYVCGYLFWLPLLPQGLVPLVFKLFGIDEVKSWFLALYLPDVWQWPAILLMIAIGVGMLVLMIQIPRQHQQQRAAQLREQ
ncbi:MAG: hypothetical protein GXY36_08125 [Chloroflexi bacterium]|nr:hypothetical protein [Chloroflexota bacterium]